jgi:hypothetical protein
MGEPLASPLTAVRAVLAGRASSTLELAGSKLLFFMLREGDGCDATITAERFWVQYSWNLAHHPYDPELAAQVVSWLRMRTSEGHLDPGLLPWWDPLAHDVPFWAYGRRTIWFEESTDRVTVFIRDAKLGFDLRIVPPPIEPPVEYPSLTHPCPHCGTVPERYRRLRDGSLVCQACGASSRST